MLESILDFTISILRPASMAFIALCCLLGLARYFRAAFWAYSILVCTLYGLFFDLYAVAVLGGRIPYYSSFQAAKDVAWLLIAAVFVLHALRTGIRELPVPHWLGLVFLGFFIYMIATLGRSYPAIGPVGAAIAVRNTFGYVLAAYMVVYSVRRRGDLLRIVKWCSCLTFGIGMYALIQFIYNLPSPYLALTGEEWKTATDFRFVHASFISYIELGLFANIMIVLLISVYGCARRYVPRHFIWPPILVAALAIVASQSRAGVAILVVLGVLSSVISEKAFLRVLVTLTMVGLIGGSLALQFSESGALRLARGDVLSDPRLASGWRELIPIINENLFTGAGMGRYGPAAVKASELGEGFTTGYVDSTFLTMLVNGGIVGILLSMILVGGIIHFVNREIERTVDPLSRGLMRGIRMALLVVLAYSIPFNVLDGFPGNFYFWFLIGLGMAIARLNRRQSMIGEREDIRRGDVSGVLRLGDGSARA